MAWPFTPRLEITEIVKWFDEVGEQEQELIGFFNIQKADGTLITIKDRFRSHFYGLPCRYTEEEKEMANIKFHTIFNENIFILMKLRKIYQDKIFTELGNFGLYQDEHITNYDNNTTTNSTSANTSNQTVRTDRNLIEGSLSGSSDSANMDTFRDQTKKAIETKGIIEKSSKKMLDYLDPNSKNVTHTVSVYGGFDTVTNTGNSSGNSQGSQTGRGNSKTTISNPFKDRLTYLGLNVPNIPNIFLEKFRVMFLC